LNITVEGIQTDLFAPGVLVQTANSIVVGQNFVGNLDDFQIFDLSRPHLLEFADGSQSAQITLDATGRATIQVNSVGNLRTNCPKEWIVEAKAYYQNILDNPKSSKLAVVTAKLAWHTVNITQGALIGDADGLDGVAADVAASFVIYGDVRDLVLIGPKVWFGFGDTADKLALAFAGLGILTTLYPPADPFVALAKSACKAVAGTRLASGIAEICKKIFKEARSVDSIKNLISRYTPFFTRINDAEYRDIVGDIFYEGAAGQTGWADKLATFQYLYRDRGATAIKRLSARYGSESNFNDILRKYVDSMVRISDKTAELGIQLTDDAMEGIGVMIRHRGEARFAEQAVDHIVADASSTQIAGNAVENMFKWIKHYEADTKVTGLEKLLKQVGNTANGTKGSYNTIQYAFERVPKIKSFEFKTKGNRGFDIETTDGTLIELKNYGGLSSSSRSTINKQFEAYLEWADDIEISPEKFRYVIRGSRESFGDDANKLVEAMLKKVKDLGFEGEFTADNIIFWAASKPY
jgi:hypothetical protein